MSDSSDPLIPSDAEDRDKSYLNLIDMFGEDELKRVFSFIYCKADNLIQIVLATNKLPAESFKVSTSIIFEIIIDYFSDLLRLKSFHNISSINTLKRSAYLAYWINLRKPIQLINEIPPSVLKEDGRLGSINEWFASYCLKACVYNMSSPPSSEYLDVLNTFNVQTRYHLKYRVTTPQVLELALVGFDVSGIYPRQKESPSEE